jgi:hypothetical protein
VYSVIVVLLLLILPSRSVIQRLFLPHSVNIMGLVGNGTSSGFAEYGGCWPGSYR